MNYITKIIGNKAIIIATTLTLTVAYVGLAKIYAEGLTKDRSTKTETYGRNAPNNFNDLVINANPENIYQIKHDLEQQLQQANVILNIIEEQKKESKHGVMN